LSALEQLALTPGARLSAECRRELATARSSVDFARLLMREQLDSLGRLGGRVVYARDFGARNALLRDRFGDRAWYVARVAQRDGGLAVTLEPLAGPVASKAR
jgi:hypothetical protein